MNNIYNVGIYIRLSKEDENLINGSVSESIKNQKNILLEEINSRDNFVLKDIYIDESYSGVGVYRPEFERMINDCKSGKINTVMCKSQSRFSRDMEIIEKYIHNLFVTWNIRFISVTDGVDSFNTSNKKARQINGLVNEWFLEDMSNNIRRALQTKMNNAEVIKPFAPFGYKLLNKKLIIDDKVSFIIRYIYDLFLEGYGYTKIANILNKKNIPSPSLYKYQNNIKLNIVSNKNRNEILWNPNAIKNILTNEIYIGTLIQGKRTTISYKNHKIINKNKGFWYIKENNHESIISKQKYLKVQELIEKRKKTKKVINKIHNFSNVVYCDCCNKMLYKKSSQKHDYLVCKNKNCINKSIRYDLLEEIVLNELNKMLENNLKEKEIIYKTNSNIINNKKEILKINNIIKNLYEDKYNKKISNDTFEYLLNTYNKNLNFLKKTVGFSNNKNTTLSIPIKSINRKLIEEFIKEIYISKNTIKIIWDL